MLCRASELASPLNVIYPPGSFLGGFDPISFFFTKETMDKLNVVVKISGKVKIRASCFSIQKSVIDEWVKKKFTHIRYGELLSYYQLNELFSKPTNHENVAFEIKQSSYDELNNTLIMDCDLFGPRKDLLKEMLSSENLVFGLCGLVAEHDPNVLQAILKVYVTLSDLAS